MKPKSHPLTSWDCLQILTKRFSDQQVRMVVEFEGRLDESRLAAAERVAAKHPATLDRRFIHARTERNLQG